jgi:hypothetical protein
MGNPVGEDNPGRRDPKPDGNWQRKNIVSWVCKSQLGDQGHLALVAHGNMKLKPQDCMA